jgi:hypothetical protein
VEITFDRVVAILGIALATVLLVLDKAGKLRGPVLLWLLALAGVMCLPVALGNSWLKETPWGMLKFSKVMLTVSLALVAYSILALWICLPGESSEKSEKHQETSGISQEQVEEIKQLDAIFSGLDENTLRNFFGFDEMVYLNMKMYKARIEQYKKTGNRSFSIAPYVQAQEMLLDTTVAGEHLNQTPGGGGYDFDPSQIALIVLPPKYSTNKKMLLRYENSSMLPTSVVIRVKNLDDILQENATQLIRVMDMSLKENADNVLYYDIPASPNWHVVETRYWRQFKDLRPPTDQIRDVCRQFLNVH